MKKLVLVSTTIAFSTLLAGCVAPAHQSPSWYKSGVSEEEAKSAHAQCIYKVGMNKVSAPKENTLIESCMMADGFRWGVPPVYTPAQSESTVTTATAEEKSEVVAPKKSTKKKSKK